MEAHRGTTPTGETPESFESPSLYLNREVNRLEFFRHVIDQARDGSLPLLERFRFLAISSSILDEFFEIRVAGLQEQAAIGFAHTGPDGLSPRETLQAIRALVLKIVEEQYTTLNESLLPALRTVGVSILEPGEWSGAQEEWLRAHFAASVLPVLTPIGLDPAHPFPRILNKSLNFIVSLDGKDAFGRRSGLAVLQSPRTLPRYLRLPKEISGGNIAFVQLASLIERYMSALFPGMKVLSCHKFRVTRNGDLWVDEEETADLLSALKGQLPRRHYGNAVRLEISAECPEDVEVFLRGHFELDPDDVYRVKGPVNLSRFQTLYDIVDRPDLKYRPFVPGVPEKVERASDWFALLRERDVLLHHPYQSFGPVIAFLRQAAADPDVLAIKQTVYRTGTDSTISAILLDAARAGKEVTAVVELRARYDEAANIDLATRLQEAGAKVVYGIVGFKAHAKMLLVVRREGGELRRYTHLGTGNYNEHTARAYTDLSLLTSDREIGEDVHAVFQQLTGLGKVTGLRKLLQTPFGLHDRLIELIDREAAEAQGGGKARIIAKMNSLTEPRIIAALYRASCAGVRIDLIVRGTCCLRPGVPGVSENIRVRAVVGRFLEHHRVFYFHARGEEVFLASSADWMPRNFFRRVEVAFPLEGKKARRRVMLETLSAYLEDNVQAYEMLPDGNYVRLVPGSAPPFSAQDRLLAELGREIPR